MGAFFSGGKGWITEPRRFSAWFGCPPQAAAFAKLLPTGFRRRKAGSEPPPPYNRHQKGACLRMVGRGGSPNHCALARGSAIREAVAFAKLLPTGFRRRKAGSEPPPPYKRNPKMGAFFSGGRGGFTNHGALARGSAVRRRRQLSRSCCQPALEDEKREANLRPLTRGTKFMVPAFCAEKGWIYEPRP